MRQPHADLSHVCSGLTLRGCEDIDDAAVLVLSKYTAADQSLPEAFSSLDLAPHTTPDSGQPATGRNHQGALPVAPMHRGVSLQRTMLGSDLLALRKSEAPSNPSAHLQPVMDSRAAESHQSSRSSQLDLRRQQLQIAQEGEAPCQVTKQAGTYFL